MIITDKKERYNTINGSEGELISSVNKQIYQMFTKMFELIKHNLSTHIIFSKCLIKRGF
jgi:hypothetical protein